MNWIKDIPTIKQNLSKTFGKGNDSKIPEGLWKSCNKCGSILYIPELKRIHMFAQSALIISK